MLSNLGMSLQPPRFDLAIPECGKRLGVEKYSSTRNAFFDQRQFVCEGVAGGELDSIGEKNSKR